MPDHERIMLSYAKLAVLSHEKGQLNPRDKFLILTAAFACRAGWPEVAERCREIVLAHNPRHLIGKAATFVDAMRDEELQPYFKQLELFCLPEKAEHLLTELGADTSRSINASEQSIGDLALELLALA